MGDAHPAPRGRLSTALRVALAALVLCAAASGLILVALLLLPWRSARLALARHFCHLVAPLLLRILGVRLSLDAREAVSRAAPAVFVINHSSTLDTLISMALWPPGGCGVGKREVLKLPFFGQAYALVGMLLIDRKNSASAVAALQALTPVVHRHRLSPWMSPEGTRSRDGRLAPFKKGYAHVAMSTGLPVVPVVIRGAFRLLPVDTFRLCPGEVIVEVLPPIDTSEWAEGSIDEHIAQTRSLFVDRLDPDQKPLEAETSEPG